MAASDIGLRNKPIIDYLANVIGPKNMSAFADEIAACTFNSRGINYCILHKSTKGHSEDRF